ncbi:MAG: efflux RND transporter periplasmic adaptor subunit, partial [Gemmatimonadota bacterium]
MSNDVIRRTKRRSLALLALTAAIAPLACSGGEAGAAEQATGDDDHARVVNVEVRPVESRDFVERIQLTGTVEANRSVTLSAEESGVIRRLPVEKGTAVAEGEPVAAIDDRILRAQLEEARARAELARETYERNRELFEDEAAISELRFLETRAQADQAAASRDALRERLDRTTIRAPFARILDDRLVEVGSMVSPGTPVARLVDLDPIKVTAGVPERYAADVRVGSTVTVGFDVLDDQEFEGRLTYVGAVVDRESRTFPVEFSLPNPGRVVKPEMVANVSLRRRQLEDVVVVPQGSLVRVEDGFVAFVAVEDEAGHLVARSRPVQLGPAQRDLAVIESGLSPGERLIVMGQQQLTDGDRVRVVA